MLQDGCLGLCGASGTNPHDQLDLRIPSICQIFQDGLRIFSNRIKEKTVKPFASHYSADRTNYVQDIRVSINILHQYDWLSWLKVNFYLGFNIMTCNSRMTLQFIIQRGHVMQTSYRVFILIRDIRFPFSISRDAYVCLNQILQRSEGIKIARNVYTKLHRNSIAV
jgi:hypothetical protein